MLLPEKNPKMLTKEQYDESQKEKIVECFKKLP